VDAEALRDDIVFDAQLRGHDLVFHTTWGIFNPRRIDAGTALLIKHVELAPSDRTLDLGCGYGAIGLAAAAACPQGSVVLVDKDFVAVDYARKNAVVNRLSNCEVLLSNGFSALAGRRFDNVLANLPGNAGRELLQILMADAFTALEPDGQIVVVTVSHLRSFIKRSFETVFGNYQKLKQGRAHTVARAVRRG
jgi:16S rRNA G1207 methylase RsmC